MPPLLARFSIRSKVVAAFAVLLCCVSGLYLIALRDLHAVKAAAADVRDNQLPSVLLLSDMAAETEQFRLLEANLALTADAAVRATDIAAMTAAREQAIQSFRAYYKLAGSGLEQQMADATLDRWQAYLALHDRIIAGMQRGDAAGLASLYLGEMRAAFNNFRAALQPLIRFNIRESREGADLGAAVAESAFGSIIALITGIALACAGLGWCLINGVSAPIAHMTDAMRRLAQHDMATAVPGLGRGDEIGAMARAVEVFRDDIIARQEGEALLRQTNLQLDATLNSMVQGILVWGADQRVQIVNKRYAAVVGVTEASVTPGMTVEDIVANYQSHGLLLDKPARTLSEMIGMLISGHPSTESEMVFRPDLIVRVITEPMPNGGAVITYEDITEKRQSQERIAFMAHHDALTGLPNRKVFQNRIDALIAERPEQDPFAVLCLDLDRFKEVNDTLGHPAGDELLRLVAGRLRGCVRDGDLVARLGGDEFAIIVEGGDAKSAAALATRLIGSISAPYELQSNHTVIGTSIGIEVFEPHVPGSELLKRADVALYRAKEDRGTFAFFEPGMDQHLQVRRRLEADLRLALIRAEFVLYYQPLYNLAEDRITGFEALIRWNSPSRGFVAPDQFIPISEQTGLIVPIGEWVLATACADAMQWPDHVRVAVNLSASQTKSKRLLPLIQEILATTGLPARRLELEITETVLLQDTDTVIATLNSLHAMGVRVSMDDFGTGYSSLSYLRRFQFDKLKIDRSFVSDLGAITKEGAQVTEPLAAAAKNAATIIHAIVGLGENLGISTTAEGVETAEQFAQVRAQGCTEVQGYFISRPQPAPEIAALLQRFENTPPGNAELQNVHMPLTEPDKTGPQTTEPQVPSPFVAA